MSRGGRDVEELDLPSSAWSDHLLNVVGERFGHELPLRRLAELRQLVRRLAAPAGFASPEQYVLALRALPITAPAVQALVRSLTIKESYFFRDRPAMSTLRDVVLPHLLEQRKASKHLRVWSAGCSTGEELYSISILLDELLPDREQWTLSLVGTDLDAHALEHARAARYNPWSMRVVLPEERARYFHDQPANGLLRLRSRYLKDTSFHLHNLVDDNDTLPGHGSFDLILCRNVLIYFSADGQREVANAFRRALAPDGLWISGSSDPSPGAAWTTAIHPGVLAHTLDVEFADRPTLERTSLSLTLRPPRAHASHAQANEALQSAAVMTVVTEIDEQQLAMTMRLADHGKLSEAAVECRALADRLPLWPRPHLLAATIAQAAGNAVEAITHLERALYLEPNDVEAQLRLGVLLAQTGSHEAAIKALRCVMLCCQDPTCKVPTDVSSTAARLLVQLLRDELG